MGRPADADKRHMIAAERHVALRPCAEHVEQARRQFQAPDDQPAVDPHHQGQVVDAGAGGMKQLAGLGIENANSEFFQHA